MKKRKKAALYDPYLDTMGGGEKHILSILKVLQEHEFEIHIFWDENIFPQIETKLHLDFQTEPVFRKNIFRERTSFIKKALELKDFDAFFYVTDGSYFSSLAGKNYIFCMVPQKKLYMMNPVNNLKTLGAKFIANSDYTHQWLTKWGIQSTTIFPYIDDSFLKIDPEKIQKDNIILSVGRFFGHLHSKRHDIAIQSFQELKKKSKDKFNDYKLVIAGGLMDEDKTYFKKLSEMIGDDRSIILKPNLTFTELLDLYKKSRYYWHLAGYGVDENVAPEQVEHFGITPLEAMAVGAIPFCYNAGGPKLFIKDSENGFLFNDIDELIKKMTTIKNEKQLMDNGQAYVKKHYSYDMFKSNVEKVIVNSL